MQRIDLSRKANEESDGQVAQNSGLIYTLIAAVISVAVTATANSLEASTHTKHAIMLACVLICLWVATASQLIYYWRSPHHRVTVISTLLIVSAFSVFIAWLIWMI